MVSCFKVITFESAVKMLVKTLNSMIFVDNLKKYPANYVLNIKFRFLDSKYAGNDVSHVSVIIMKEESAIYVFVIIIFKMASRSPNFGGKKWHPLFFH